MNTMSIRPTKHRKLLLKCLAISLAAHTAALSYFYFHPLILQSPFQSLFGMTSVQPVLLENEEDAFLAKNHLLEEVFQKIVVLSPHFQQPYDLIELPKGIALAPNREHVSDPSLIAVEEPIHFQKPDEAFASRQEIQLDESQELNCAAFFNPPELGAPIASQLQIDAEGMIPQIPMIALPQEGNGMYEDLIAVSNFSFDALSEELGSLNLTAQLSPPVHLKIDEDLSIKADPKVMAAHIAGKELRSESEHLRAPLFVPKALEDFPQTQVELASKYSELDEYNFSDLNTPGEWNDDFDIDVTFLPNPEGKGYIFSLSLSSNYDLSSYSLKQNLYFILDRSSSVQKHRFAVFKRAVLKALASMEHGDTFNIIVMDKKISKFSPENRPVSLKNIHAAEEFLDKQEAGGLFNSADVYASIDKILSFVPENDQQHTAILLTDGKMSMNAEQKQKALKKWVDKNQGKMSLYACAIGADNDLLSLDMLCSLSGGKLLYSDTHASFPRKLAKLVLDLKDPVAKNLSISAIAENPNSNIEFYSANPQMSSLYGHQPYVIVGQIDEPCSFDLVIQGRHRGEWIAIKKNVSFIDGHKGDTALEKMWDAEHANICYSKFVKEGSLKHLKEAKEILKKSHLGVAFE